MAGIIRIVIQIRGKKIYATRAISQTQYNTIEIMFLDHMTDFCAVFSLGLTLDKHQT